MGAQFMQNIILSMMAKWNYLDEFDALAKLENPTTAQATVMQGLAVVVSARRIGFAIITAAGTIAVVTLAL